MLSLLLLSCVLTSSARVHWSLAEDLYAFPKYRVTFLNGQPVLNETAERWLKHGLNGGEREFLDQPWGDPQHPFSSALKEIEGAEGASDVMESDQRPRYSLQRMHLSGQNQYVCLIPPPIESHTDHVEEPQLEANPAQTWSLLQPLSGSCLYHRQVWFTYAYCHNNQVRQFREIAHSHPHHAGYVPEEDPEWEAFTLGQAATIPGEGRELTNAQQAALTSNVDIAHTAGHRYLVQKWGDGTICDKTGKPREIEVQFHCSTTMTDTIIFVKETQTCHYVMVIHTPRLCGEPGFKTRLEQRDEAFIRCREVLSDESALAAADKSLPDSPYPSQVRTRNPILGAPPTLPTASVDSAGADGQKAPLTSAEQLVMQALGALLSGGGRGASAGNAAAETDDSSIRISPGKDGEVIIEFDEPADGEDPLGIENVLENFFAESAGNIQRMRDILRAAGHDVDGARQPQERKEGGGNANSDTDGAEKRKQKKGEDARRAHHVEL